MNAGVRIGICALIAALTTVPHRLDAQARTLPQLIPPQRIEGALKDVVGRTVVEELARRIGESADANCLKSRNLTPAALQRQTRDLLASYGTRLAALQSKRVTDDALAKQLDELAGLGSAAELRGLADGKQIKRLHAYYRPRLNDDLVDRITAALDHYAVIHRIPIGRLNAINLGKVELAIVAAERAAAAEKAVQQAFGADPRLRRLADLFGKLLDAHERVLITSTGDDKPNFFAFAGVEERFRALCLRIGE